MPVLLYVFSVIATILASSHGLTLLAVATSIIAAALVFRYELRDLRLPTDARQTDP